MIPFDADTPEEQCPEGLLHEGHGWADGDRIVYCEGIGL